MAGRLALALVLLAGCTANNTNAPGAVADRLRECGLISEGELQYLPFQLYAPDDCYRDCLAGASCVQLEDAMCDTSIELARACDERCAYRCGDDSLIAPDQECDGVMNCPDGEDEVGCPVGVDPSCRDAVACDGYPQCEDGRDEVGCAMWMCDGQEYPYNVRCDGWRRCEDGSDEVGCATVTTMCPMP